MRKIATLSLTLLSLSASLAAEWDSVHFDGRVAAFYPTGSLFRELYGTWLVDYEFEIGNVFFKHYEAWANVDWVSASGYTQGFHSKTTIDNLNVSVGAKYVFRFPWDISLSLGLGINEAFVYVHNDYDYVKRNVHKTGVGGVAKLGLYYEPVDYLFLEFFTDYLYQEIRFQNTEQVGGLKIGGGVGLQF